MSVRLSAAVLAMLVSLVAACGGGSGSTKTTQLPPIGTTGWTVLVYMTADNNLEGDALRDLTEMASIDSGTDLRFVVQADRAVGEAAGAFVNAGDWTSTKRFVVRRGQVQDQVDLGEVNMGLSASLSSFITWGVTTYPGQRYMLVFWDHGGGWKGFGWDDSHLVGGVPDHLSLDRIVTGMQTGLAATSVAKFDMIGFDACLMATVEVAESMKPYANYLLASEETEPGHGWDWAAFAGGGPMTSVQLGTKIADGFYAQASAAPWNDAAGVTLSLVNLGALGPVEAAMAALATAYPNAGAVASVLGTVADGRQRAVEYAFNPNPAQAYALVDAVDLFSKMGGVTGAATLQAAIQAAVVYERHGAAKAGSHGLSIYFPADSLYYAAEYNALPGMTSWRTFLNAVYGGGDAQAVPAFDSGSDAVSVSGLTVSGILSAATVSAVNKSYMRYGLDDGAGGAILLGDQPATKSGANVTSTWDWTVPMLYQGGYSELGYLSFEQVSANVFTASFPLTYEPPASASEFAVWQIAFDGTGALLTNTVYLYSGGGVAELNPAPGSKLRALVMLMPSLTAWTTSWQLYDAGGAGFDATQPIGIDLPAIPSGWTGAAVLRSENSAGDGAWIYSWGDVKP